MSDLNLAIFPADTMAISITTTVLVGVWVVVFFNLRFGWVLSGLVVPGYLVPLLIAKPVSAAVILVEAILTYAIVRFASEGFKHRPGWSSFFGRDRFFALVVVSILVRIMLDGWLLPAIGPSIQSLLGDGFDYRNHFHSYGLIIVALIANGFWKPGLLRGITPLGVTVGTTYLIVRFVLVEATNFNVGSLQYMYEDVASSLLASPKSYIILVTTAFIASRMNLRYSWDYNGILVPSLLALQWHEPSKILTSLVEAFVILMLAKVVLKLPICQRTTIEGGRKILLFFNLAFLYRLALCYLVPVLLPMVKVTDTYGFGYLLSTLLAMRAHDKNLTLNVTRAAAQVSLLGAAAGSLIGFSLTFLPSVASPPPSGIVNYAGQISASDQDLTYLFRHEKLTLYRQHIPGNYVLPTASDLNWFQMGLKHLRHFQETRETEDLQSAQRAMARANYSVQRVEERYLYLREQPPARGWGLYVLDLKNPDGVVVEVPAPLDEWSTIEAGLSVFLQLEGGALAVAGASRHACSGGVADVLSNPLTIYGAFHRQQGRGNVLEVRGYTRRHADRFQRIGASKSNEPIASSLWIKNAIPPGCRLDRLREQLHDWKLHWQPTPLSNVLRDNTRSGFAELVLTRSDRRRMLASLVATPTQSHAARGVEVMDLPLRQWLLQRKQQIATRGSGQYVRPDIEHLLYLDEQVVKPLLHLIQGAERYAELPQLEREELQAVAAAASLMDYGLFVLPNGTGPEGTGPKGTGPEGTGPECLVLAPAEGRLARCWGTYVFRFGMPRSHLILVPRPLHERNVYEFAVTLFDRIDASCLLIAGAHPGANVDGSADVIRLENRVNMLNLVHQVCLRQWGSQPMMVTSVRAIRAPVDAEVIVALSDGTAHIADANPLQRELLDALTTDRLVTQLADGSSPIAGYEVGSVPQFTVLALSEHKQFASLWLSPSLRRAYRYDALEPQFLALGIPTVTTDLYEYLRARPGKSRLELPDTLREIVEQFVRSRDIVCLRKAQREFSQYSLLRLVDHSSQQAFLLIERPGSDSVPAVASLSEPTEKAVAVVSGELQPGRVQEFIRLRAVWLESERRP